MQVSSETKFLQSIPYLTQTLSFDGADAMAWHRVYCGQTGKFHQIELYNNASNQTVQIHAIVPWFRPEGRFMS